MQLQCLTAILLKINRSFEFLDSVQIHKMSHQCGGICRDLGCTSVLQEDLLFGLRFMHWVVCFFFLFISLLSFFWLNTNLSKSKAMENLFLREKLELSLLGNISGKGRTVL